MEAKELRINNIVSIVGKPSNERFNYSLPSGQSIDMIFVKRNNHYPKPIPLTEEWLVEFGFEKALNGWWSDNEIWSYNDGKFYLGANTYLSNVKYVHQLQNLYFALTNEELTLK